MSVTVPMSGIADEAGMDIDSQIRAHQALGWSWIELRAVDGTPVHDLSDRAFDRMRGRLADAGLRVSAFSSSLANWATRISYPFKRDQAILRRALPRLKQMDCRFLRVMSWPNDGWGEAAWRNEAVRRMRELCRAAGDAGVVLALENCDGWASTSAKHFAAFFEEVGHPALQALYDTGNPASHGDPDAWPWYQAAKGRLSYIHIKTCNRTFEHGDTCEYVWPEEGLGQVAEVLQDAFASGFRGFVSIEPHMKAVIHTGSAISNAEAAFQTYVEYGRRAERLVRQALVAGGKPMK